MPTHRTFAVAMGVPSILAAYLAAAPALSQPGPIPDKTVVLTFDDAVKSHVTVVAPILSEYGFGATFFITECWMSDTENFLSWEDVGALHGMGFEIGNHTWNHAGMSTPKSVAHLAGQLALVESALARVNVPKPVSFAWPGNGFSSEGVEVLRACGYQFARRGMQPEIPYGKIEPGPLYDPARYDPLLIPSAGDAYPEWMLEDFKRVVDRARNGHIAVVQFHGVPDVAHPWVHTPPERFKEYMAYLKDGGFNVIAMRDLARYVDPAARPDDAMTHVRYGGSTIELPPEVAATRQNLEFWLPVMLRDHRYTLEEAALVCAYPPKLLEERMAGLNLDLSPAAPTIPDAPLRVLPYPGGRHPRIGFLDGAIDPMRGTKISVFTPWGDGGYVVVDLPEAIFSNLGLTYLAHTHIPTIWDEQHVFIDNVDWKPRASGGWENAWRLPNGIRFGGSVEPAVGHVDMTLWLENATDEPLTKLRTQVCCMLKGAPGFNATSDEGKRFEGSVAAASGAQGNRWILVAFERCGRDWGNARVPCIHADPVLPDAAPGQRVEVKGRLWFYEGNDVDGEIARAQATFHQAP